SGPPQAAVTSALVLLAINIRFAPGRRKRSPAGTRRSFGRQPKTPSSRHPRRRTRRNGRSPDIHRRKPRLGATRTSASHFVANTAEPSHVAGGGLERNAAQRVRK